MKKAKVLLCAALCTAMLVSCNLFPSINQEKPIDDIDIPLEKDSFYAQNMANEKYYKVKAETLYEGEKCVIWAEKSANITQRTAIEIAKVYDTIIRPRIVNTFSKKDFYTNEKAEPFDDMLDYANWLAGGNDGKLTILLLDIQDGFTGARNDSYVAGYFSGNNFYPKGKISGSNHYSNGRDMIYIDTYPGLRMQPRMVYATFAHELQHLINYVTSRQMRRRPMDTWIDEGLSSRAEYLYLEENPPEKCEWFSDDKDGTIAKGNNFFVWDNHREISLAILDDYATVYLFFRWLYLQASAELQSHIFLDIAASVSNDYRAVTDAAKQINPAWVNWENLLGTWLAANYYPRNNYGYTGDDYLQKTIKVKPITGQTISLYPGEGVYSIINNSFNPDRTSANIYYAGLAENKTIIGTSPPYTGNVLLTFNANTRNTEADETGCLTGISPPASQTAARNIQTGKLTGFHVIDARDMPERFKR